jgi:PAS domain S-box-containing protein
MGDLMKDDNKTKKQLVQELMELRSQNAALKESDSAEKYRSLVENIRDVIYELDSQGVVLYISPAIRDMLGYDSAEIVGKNFIELAHKDDRSSLTEWFSKLRKGTEYPSEYRVTNKSGELRWAQTKTRPIMEDGLFNGARGILIDVTKQKQAQEALRESEEKYRWVLDNMADVITVMDMNLRFTYVSPSIVRMRGYTAEEATAQTIEQVMTPESLQIVAKVFEEEMKLEASGTADPARSRILVVEQYRKDGSIVLMENHLSFMRDETQKAVGIISLTRDITERKRDEAKLRQQTDAMDAATDGIALLNAEGEYVYLNNAHVKVYGYENAGELIGKSWRILYDSDVLQHFDQEIMPAFSRKGDWHGEAIGMKKDGSKFPQEISLTSTADDGLICVVRDITERKQSEVALSNSEVRLRTLLQTIPDLIWLKDKDGVYLSCNTMFERFFGAREADIVGKTDYDFVDRDLADSFLEHDRKAMAAGKPTINEEWITFADDGHRAFLETIKTPMHDSQGTLIGVLGIGHDITKRKKAEEELSKSEKKYRDLYDFLPIPVYEMDLEANLTSANHAIYEAFRGTEEDLKKGFKVWQLLSPEEIERSAKNIQRLLKGEQIGGTEYTLMRLDGSVFPAIVISSVIYSDGKPVGLRGAIVDITERRQQEEALLKSEGRYRLIAENMADIISVTDMNLRFTYISPSITRIRGFTVEEAMQHTLDQVMTPESLKITIAAFEEEMKLEASGTADPDRVRIMELEEYKKDGSLIWLEVGFSFLRDKDGKPVAMLAVSRDISARKRAEDELKKSKALLESVFNSSQDLMLVVDRDLKILMSNWKSLLYAGHTEFPINSHCYEAFNHRDIPCEPCHALSVFNTGEPIREEHYNQYTQLFMEVNAYPIFDDNHHVIMVAEHVRNITDRKQAAERIRKALGATVQAIAVTVETRDPYTAGHQRRVADLARSIATEMNLPAEQIDGIRMAATIHDLGKISVPAEILSKPKKLTNIEFSLIKTHAQSGYEILKDIDFPWPIARMILEHHERINGSGYPNGLIGEEALLESRILSVADVVESMGSHRPYRPSLGIEEALEEIEKNRGTLYDNTAVDACLRLFREKGYQLP